MIWLSVWEIYIEDENFLQDLKKKSILLVGDIN